jgi:hypothetical protein
MKFASSLHSKLIASIQKRGLFYTVEKSFKFLIFDFFSMVFRHSVYRLRYRASYPSAYKLINVDGDDLKYKTKPQFSKDYSKYGHHVINGDWDVTTYEENTNKRGLLSYDNWDFYNSFHRHFVEEIPWSETKFYNKMVNNPPAGRTRYGSKKEVKERLNKIDELYNDISKNGYKPQRKAMEEPSVLPQTPIIPEHNEMKVAIGRDGDIVLEDGRHRAAIVSILDIDSIPVRVMVRHKEWQEKRSQLANSSLTPDELGINESHPDIQDVLD